MDPLFAAKANFFEEIASFFMKNMDMRVRTFMKKLFLFCLPGGYSQKNIF